MTFDDVLFNFIFCTFLCAYVSLDCEIGIQYMSKLDEFESFVERIRKYGLVSSSLTRVSPSSVVLLIDDLPMVNGKASFGRLQKCLYLLLQSVRLPTAILINDYGRSESAEQHSRYWEELQLSLQNAGAYKVVFLTLSYLRATTCVLLMFWHQIKSLRWRLIQPLSVPSKEYLQEFADWKDSKWMMNL